MHTIEIGVRFSVEQAPDFFGIDEVNRLIAGGASVLRLEPAALLMQKTGAAAAEGTVSMYVSGFAAKVVLDDSRCAGWKQWLIAPLAHFRRWAANEWRRLAL